MNEYAILLKRVSSDTLRNFYTYEAEEIIRGHLDEEENIFLRDNNEKIVSFGNKKMLNKTNKKFVGLVLTEEELMYRYEEAQNINEALSLFYMDATKVMTVVSFDYNNNEIKMGSIDKIGVIDNLNNLSKIKESKEIEKNIDKSSIEYKYQELKKQIGENFTLITEAEYKNIMDFDNLDDFTSYISILQFTKETYLEKLKDTKNTSNWVIFIEDDILMPVYYYNNIEEAKTYLESIKEKGKENEEFDSMKYLCRKFKEIKEDVLQIEDLNLLIQLLNAILEDLKESKKQFVFMVESGIDISDMVELLDIYINGIEEILVLEDIDEMKSKYDHLYTQTEGFIISVGLNINKNLKEEKQAKKSDNVSFDDIINNLNKEEIIELYNISIENIQKLELLEQIKIYTFEMIKNFKSIKEKMLEMSDIEIEEDLINNLCDNIIYCYEEIHNMKNISEKEDLLKEINEYIYEDIVEFASLFEEITTRTDETISIKERKEIILNNLIKKIEKPYNELQDLVGLEDIKKHVDILLKERVYDLLFDERKVKRKRNYNYFFSGNPGTGKTTVADILCEILAKLGMIKENKIKKTTASDFIAGYVGQTAIKTKKLIEECKGGVIFIDEAYALSQTTQSSFSQDVFGELLPAISSGEVSVILAGYNDEMKVFLDSNTGIKDRINNYFEFKDYSVDELTDMFVTIAKYYDYKVSDDAKELFKEIVKEEMVKKNFGNGRVVKNFTDKILDSHEINMIDYDIEDDTIITALDIENAKLKDNVYKEKVKKLGF